MTVNAWVGHRFEGRRIFFRRATGAVQMKGGVTIGLLALVSFHAKTAIAKDKPFPMPPCPIEGQLRVAGAGSLSGFQMLDNCAAEKVIVAPASVRDYIEQRDLRIAPNAEPRMLPVMAGADDGYVVRIAPKMQEAMPVEFSGVEDGTGDTQAGAILAMRPVSYSTPYDDMIARVAERHRVDPLLLHAVIKQESSYKAHATSHAGARGLMQLMPATARMLGIGAGSIAHAESNVDGGARLLRRLHARYNDFPLVLAAYNAGEGAVAKYGNRIPPYRETQDYVQKVLGNYQRLLAEQNRAGR
jgi:Transglycosylase SLT domain